MPKKSSSWDSRMGGRVEHGSMYENEAKREAEKRKKKGLPPKKKRMTEHERYQDNIKRYEKKLGRKLKWHDYETDNKSGMTTKKTDEYWKMLDAESGGQGKYAPKKKKTEYDHYLESKKSKKKKKKPVEGLLEKQGY